MESNTQEYESAPGAAGPPNVLRSTPARWKRCVPRRLLIYAQNPSGLLHSTLIRTGFIYLNRTAQHWYSTARVSKRPTDGIAACLRVRYCYFDCVLFSSFICTNCLIKLLIVFTSVKGILASRSKDDIGTK